MLSDVSGLDWTSVSLYNFAVKIMSANILQMTIEATFFEFKSSSLKKSRLWRNYECCKCP